MADGEWLTRVYTYGLTAQTENPGGFSMFQTQTDGWHSQEPTAAVVCGFDGR